MTNIWLKCYHYCLRDKINLASWSLYYITCSQNSAWSIQWINAFLAASLFSTTNEDMLIICQKRCSTIMFLSLLSTDYSWHTRQEGHPKKVCRTVNIYGWTCMRTQHMHAWIQIHFLSKAAYWCHLLQHAWAVSPSCCLYLQVDTTKWLNLQEGHIK